MDTQKEKWKDEVMNSITGIQRAEPGPFLLARIKHRIKASEEQVVSAFQPAFIRLAMVCLVLLFIVNVTVLINSAYPGSNGKETGYSYGSSLSRTFNLYEE